MLINITWALVLVGLGLLVGGFVASDNNVLLILAIASELAAIVLVLATWARRAKDAATGTGEDLVAFADDEVGSEEELYAALEDSDEPATTRTTRINRAPRTARAAAKPKARPKSTARKATPKPAARSASKSAAPAAAKRKPVAAKAKPKAKAAPKAKPKPKAKAKPKGTPRRRPPSASR